MASKFEKGSAAFRRKKIEDTINKMENRLRVYQENREALANNPDFSPYGADFLSGQIVTMALIVDELKKEYGVE